MSFAFCFDREDDVYQFAYCYPYTYSRLQHYLSNLEQRNLDYLKREQLGLSVVSVWMCVGGFISTGGGVGLTLTSDESLQILFFYYFLLNLMIKLWSFIHVTLWVIMSRLGG